MRCVMARGYDVVSDRGDPMLRERKREGEREREGKRNTAN